MALTLTAGTSVESTASQSSTTVTLPAGLAAGDYTIIFISVNATNANITTPAGWTDILADTNSVNGSTSMAHAIFYRKWVSGDTNPTISHSSGRVAATPVKVTGADQTTFVNTTPPVTQAASGATTIVAPTITPSSSAVIAVFTGRRAQNGVFMTPFSNLSATMTAVAEACGKATNATNAGHLIAYETVSPDVATGTRQADPAGATTGAFGLTFALNVAPSGESYFADGTLAGEGALSVPTVTPNIIKTPELSGSGSLAAVGVFGPPNSDFDDGTMQGWSGNTTGSGTVQVLTAAKHDGTYGLRATAPTDADAASISRSITPTPKARIAGWYRVTAEGLQTTNVSFARFMNGSTILAGMYRQNVTAGPNIWLRTATATSGFYYTSTGVRAEVGDWVYIDFEWDQTTGTPTVKVNGNLVISAAAADWNAATTIDSIVIGAPETAKAGVWEADTLQINDYQAAFNGSGEGTLTVSVKPGFNVSTSLGGAGTLAPAQSVGLNATANLSGSGTLTKSTTAGSAASASLSGTGTLTTIRTFDIKVTAPLSGDGTLTVEQDNVTQTRSVNLSGTGTLSRTPVVNFTGSMASSGEGTLAVQVEGATRNESVVMSGTGTLSVVVTPSVARSVALSGTGTLTRVVTPGANVSASLSGSGSLVATTAGAKSASASLSGTGTLSVTVVPNRIASVNLSGTGNLVPTVGSAKSTSASLSGQGTLVANLTTFDVAKTAALSGSGQLSATAIKTNLASTSLSGSGQLTVTVSAGRNVTVDLSGEGTMERDTTPAFVVIAALNGSGSLGAFVGVEKNYTVTARLLPRRWAADLNQKRWKGSL